MNKIVREAAFRIKSECGMDDGQFRNFIQELLQSINEPDLHDLTPTREEKNDWAKEGLVWDERFKRFVYEI